MRKLNDLRTYVNSIDYKKNRPKLRGREKNILIPLKNTPKELVHEHDLLEAFFKLNYGRQSNSIDINLGIQGLSANNIAKVVF